LAQGIGYCLNNNVDNMLSEVARKKVVENFAVHLMGDVYVKLYKNLIQ